MIYIDIVRLECADSEDMYIGTVAEPHRFTTVAILVRREVK